MAPVSDLAAWTGVAGAAVGGGLAFVAAGIQATGQVRSVLEQVRSANQADAYVRLSEYLRKSIAEAQIRQLQLRDPGGAYRVERYQPSAGADDWIAMQGRVRVFGSETVRAGLFEFEQEAHRVELFHRGLAEGGLRDAERQILLPLSDEDRERVIAGFNGLRAIHDKLDAQLNLELGPLSNQPSGLSSRWQRWRERARPPTPSATRPVC